VSAKKFPLIGCTIHMRKMITTVISVSYIAILVFWGKKMIAVIEKNRTESHATMKKKN
jgi:hypothetical protein